MDTSQQDRTITTARGNTVLWCDRSVGLGERSYFDEELLLLGQNCAPFFDSLRPKAFVIGGKSRVGNHVHLLRPREGISITYLKYYLDYSGFITGIAISKLNRKSMRKIPVPLAPLAEEKRVADKISGLFLELDSVSSILSDLLRELDSYREFKVRHAFDGKITDKWRNKGIH
jgi:type I restriction enzyme S subunit